MVVDRLGAGLVRKVRRPHGKGGAVRRVLATDRLDAGWWLGRRERPCHEAREWVAAEASRSVG